MKKIRRFFTALFILTMLFSLHITSLAGNVTGGYTYTVRLFSGQQGTFESVDVTIVLDADQSVRRYTFQNCDTIVVTGLMYNDQIIWECDTQNMELTESDNRYYVKGIRASGKDNDTIQSSDGKKRAGSNSSSASKAITVTGDADYVVGYGLLVDPVEYTVRYIDAASRNELAESRTFYGNIGDKPVVAYRYIDGWQPQAYNITGKLVEDPSKNIFTFEYTPVPSGGVIYNTIVIPGTVIDLGTEVVDLGGGGGGGGAAVGGGDGGGGDAGAEAGPVDDQNPETDIQEETPPLAEQPDDLLDLDAESTPLLDAIKDGVDTVTNVIGDGVLLFAGIPTAGKISLLIAVVAVVVAGIATVIHFNKRKKENEE
ncbi:MAG: hypothetical protein NC541_13780 [bacterium]|nr:hypothetical protein [bacterium]